MIVRGVDRNEKEIPSSTELRPETKSPETMTRLNHASQRRGHYFTIENLKITSILSHKISVTDNRTLRACLQILHSELEPPRKRGEKGRLRASCSLHSILLKAPNLHNPTLPASDRPHRFPSFQNSQQEILKPKLLPIPTLQKPVLLRTCNLLPIHTKTRKKPYQSLNSL